jgi:hypothetical protein
MVNMLRVFCVLVLLLPSDGWAKSSGALKFDKLAVDFGDVLRGEDLEANFTFKNIGAAPVKIHAVHSACGCATVNFDRERQYQAGEKGVLQIRFDPNDFDGHVSKQITVMTSEIALPARVLSISARVSGLVMLRPPVADFGDFSAGQTPAKIVIELDVQKGVVMKTPKIVHDEDKLQVNYRETAGRYFLDVQLNQVNVVGFVKEQVRVEFDAGRTVKLMLPVRASVVGGISSKPQFVEFGAIPSANSVERSIRFSGKLPFVMKPKKIELRVNGVSIKAPAQMLTIESSGKKEQQHSVKLKLSNKAKQTGSLHGRIVFETGQKSQAEFALDFYGFFL